MTLKPKAGEQNDITAGPEVVRLLSESDDDPGSRLARRMADAWSAGQRLKVEQILAECEDEALPQNDILRLIYEEVCLREEAGDQVDFNEILSRFPFWRNELNALFQCHRWLQGESESTRMPEVGEQLGEFALVALLDTGAAGRVFLATQPALCDRPVVLKVTARRGNEHLKLAQLQHTSIVPLYFIIDDPERGVRALGMPYVGGSSLARLLHRLHDKPVTARSGLDLVKVLREVQREAPLAREFQGPTLTLLQRSSYVEAVCWIGACLADALHYAHERNLVHLDVKPGNVLLAGDGQPMLLDFHLAHAAIPRLSSPPEYIGGTPGYLSPEQERVMEAATRGEPTPVAIDGRSDIYSLGLLLYEALAGSRPCGGERPPLHEVNRQVSLGLSDIIEKCLAPTASQRYPSAAELAADLRRLMVDLPLRGVPNRSWLERWRKWRRRSPRGLTLVSLSAALLCALLLLASMYFDRVERARTAREDGGSHISRNAYGQARARYQHGLGLLHNVPFTRSLRSALETDHDRAEARERKDLLKAIVEELRFLDTVDGGQEWPNASRQRDQLRRACSRVWNARESLAEQFLEPGEMTLPASVEADLVDLAILRAQLEVRQDRSEEAYRRALQIFDELGQWHPPAERNPVVIFERSRLREAISGRPAVDPRDLQLENAWHHYAVGRRLMWDGKYELAAEYFAKATQSEPDKFWPHFGSGACSYYLQRYDEALRAFSVCIALQPQRYENYYSRALAYLGLGDRERAKEDYERARLMVSDSSPPLRPFTDLVEQFESATADRFEIDP